MDKVSLYFTVYFDNPFWVGVIERVDNSQLQVYKITFGQEPHDEEVLQVINNQYLHLQFGPPVVTSMRYREKGFKRQQRDVRKQMMLNGIGTKSQQALKQQYELSQEIRKKISHENLLKEKQFQFDLKQQKKKEKHKGH